MIVAAAFGAGTLTVAAESAAASSCSMEVETLMSPSGPVAEAVEVCTTSDPGNDSSSLLPNRTPSATTDFDETQMPLGSSVPPVTSEQSRSIPMAVPFECRSIPESVIGFDEGMCDAPEPVAADPADPVPGAPVAPVAGGAVVPAVPAVTDVIVAEALRRLPLSGSVLEVEPPNGRTLVNFDTNFFTVPSDQSRSLVLLNQQVDLLISPVSYRWVFGDGASVSTSGPGAPYPDLEVTHRYLRKGSVSPSVETTYVAQFRVEGGPWAPVPGSVSVAGDPVDLEAVEARPILVG